MKIAFGCDHGGFVAKEKESRAVWRDRNDDIAPYKACVLPLSKKLSGEATEVFQSLQKHFMVDYDEAGSIGKRYRRQDEIGTPWCITYDFDTEETGNVTVRNRDTMEQITLKMEEVASYIEERLDF